MDKMQPGAGQMSWERKLFRDGKYGHFTKYNVFKTLSTDWTEA